MSSLFEKKTDNQKAFPKWPKALTLALLLIAMLLGGVFTVKKLRQTTHPGNSGKTISDLGKPGGLQALFNRQNDIRPSGSITYQGMVVGKNGVSVAVINGEMIAVGASFASIRILGITETGVLVECNGQTSSLSPGECFTPGKR